MTQSLVPLGPLMALGFGAVAAMLLAPRHPALARRAAFLAFALALTSVLSRWDAPALPSALLRDDALARFGLLLAIPSGLAALTFLRPALPAKEGPALALLATLGAAVLCEVGHAASVFLGMELVTLSLVALFVLPMDRPALEAGYKFLILGAAAAAMLLFGFALTHAATGSLELSAWSAGGVLVSLGAALLLAGLAFKFALVPFHMWTPDAFSGAPAAAAALAGVASKIGVLLVLLRLDAAGPPEPVWSLGLMLTGAGSILLGNLLSLRQESLVRMLGYSSIAHSGYLAVALGSGAALAPEAALFYLAAYAPALLAALCVAARLGPDPQRDDLRGLVWRNPLAGLSLALALLSMAGLPLAAGFLGKFYVFSALIAAGHWPALAVAIAGSALGLYYYLRFLTISFRQAPEAEPLALSPGDALLLALCALLTAWIGVYPQPLVALARAALP
ncbi:MAG: proton-conducting transporter membrane subunit [Cereibacter changlensis]